MRRVSDIGIVGSGLSGSLTLINLLTTATKPLRVVVFEKNKKRIGRGIAYSNDYVYQPLNVNVEGMTLYENEPLHFFRWILANVPTENLPDDFSRRSFVSRHWFGDYLSSELQNILDANPQHEVSFVYDEVTRVAQRHTLVDAITAHGDRYRFNRLVLALGNFLPATVASDDLNYVHQLGYEADPWRDGLLDDIALNEKVLFLGSGLTTVDLLINLKLREHDGQVYVLSRNGRLPSVHNDKEPQAVDWNENDFNQGLLHLLRVVRSRMTTALRHGHDWRNVIDSLRVHTPAVWRNLSADDKRIFLQRLRVFWETHRHRMTPTSYRFLRESFDEDNIALVAGNVKNISVRKNGFIVTYRVKGPQLRTLFVNRIVNCTGPESNYRNIDRPLVQGMLRDGLAAQDALSLGLLCDDRGRLINADRKVSDELYALGPLRRGVEWESTALREIRRQASDLASLLLEQSHQAVPR